MKLFLIFIIIYIIFSVVNCDFIGEPSTSTNKVKISLDSDVKAKEVLALNTSQIYVSSTNLTNEFFACYIPISDSLWSQYLKATQEDNTILYGSVWFPMIATSVSQPATYNGIVTITGKNMKTFLPSDRSFIQNSNELPLSSINVLSNTQITAKVLPGAGKFTLKVEDDCILKTENQVGTVATFTVQYQSPIIQTVSQSENILNINGLNFGPSSGFLNLKIDGVAVDNSLVTISATHNMISFDVTKYVQTTKSIVIDLSVGGNSIAAPYTAQIKPYITTMNSVPTKGGNLTIVGQFLNTKKQDGVTASTVEVLVNNNIKCNSPFNPVAGDNTMMVCQLQAGDGEDLPVKVTIDTISNDIVNSPKFTYGIPKITSVRYDAATDKVVVEGESVGTPGKTTNVLFNNLTISSTTSDYDSISFQAPHTTLNGMVQLVISDKRKSGLSMVKFIPMLKSISTSPTVGGVVTIQGPYLSTRSFEGEIQEITIHDKNQPTLVFKDCFDSASIKSTVDGSAILCTVSPGVGKDYKVEAILEGAVSQNNVSFSYLPPTLSQSKQNVTKGNVYGDNLGPVGTKVSVVFNNQTIDGVVNSESIIEFEIPPLDKSGSLYVIVASQNSNSTTIDIIPNIGGFSAVETKGGIVSVYGGFFYHTDSSVISVKVGDLQCTNAKVVGGENRIIECELPAGTGKGKDIKVTIDNLEVVNPNAIKFQYAAPTVIDYTSVNRDGGQVTLQGTSFGIPLSVKIGDRVCEDALLVDTTMIECTLPKWDIDEDDVPTLPLDIYVECDSLSSTTNMFVYKSKSNRVKWLVPAIVVPVVVGSATIAAVSYILYKKKQKVKEFQLKLSPSTKPTPHANNPSINITA
ncbi:immunoglobulin E-set domain-containing protein [Tieghemostelium lacteum]|uniref:Immunoglobulin E-set domain-containing protein n=1 Tax=Tieghemostelium lacteum TaxID=361077 RepID=A0A151ZHD4_TIELA|nr:immunoglobulin E-set domain-containing protein [Tieghemostelium lacteum]|eukprot:KYQ93376.1 immunoglobulin E-set domain-containing protein [Tieghemostelium lacteum]